MKKETLVEGNVFDIKKAKRRRKKKTGKIEKRFRERTKRAIAGID